MSKRPTKAQLRKLCAQHQIDSGAGLAAVLGVSQRTANNYLSPTASSTISPPLWLLLQARLQVLYGDSSEAVRLLMKG